LWIQEEIFKDLKWENISVLDIEDNTHDIIKKGKIGLLGFKKTGEYIYEDNPLVYKDD